GGALVARQEVGTLEESLADSAHVAVPEDTEAAAEEAVLDAVALDVLSRQEADESLRRRQPHGPHVLSSAVNASSSCSSSSSSRPPAIRRTSSCLSSWDFVYVPRLRPRFRMST